MTSVLVTVLHTVHLKKGNEFHADFSTFHTVTENCFNMWQNYIFKMNTSFYSFLHLQSVIILV